MTAARRGTLAMVCATALWGATFILLRDALPNLPVAALVTARFAVAAAVLAGAQLLRRKTPRRIEIVAGLACAPFLAAFFALQAHGLRETSAGSSAFLTCAGTLSAPFLAWAVLRQRPAREVWIGMPLALAGSALLSWRAGIGFGRGELTTLFGAMLYAAPIVIVAPIAARVDAVWLAAAQAIGVAACALPFARPEAIVRALDPSAPGAWRVAYLALAGSAVAPWLQMVAQRSLDPGRISLLFALEPLFALLCALLWGAERFQPRWWFGAALIVSASALAARSSSVSPSNSPPPSSSDPPSTLSGETRRRASG